MILRNFEKITAFFLKISVNKQAINVMLIPIIQPHASEGQDQIMVGSCLGHTGVKRSIIEHQLTVG